MADRYIIDTELIKEGAVVPEGMKRLAQLNKEKLAEKKAAIAAKSKEIEKKRADLKVRTLKNEASYVAERKHLTEMRRKAVKDGDFFVAPEPKVIFAIRLIGTKKMAPKPRKILFLLRLRQINNAVFLPNTKPIREMIRLVAPFITFGYPSLTTIRQLMYKRGYAKINGQRLRLTDNEMVSDNLGEHGMHGVEDLVHEIYTAGPNFTKVTRFLWPFKLGNPSKGFKAKRHAFTEMKGGDWGNRENFINELVKRMNKV